MANNLSFIHRFKPATHPGIAPLLLLHGTGGDESDLLPLGQMVSPGAALLSVRGQALKLPAFLEPHRKEIAAVLPALDEKVA